MPIGVVERETGLTRDTLRKWETRYGFPSPMRDPKGERLYPSSQVKQLSLVKRLLDQGIRPAKLLRLNAKQLQYFAETHTPPASPSHDEFAANVLDALHRHDPASLRQCLLQELLDSGLGTFVQANLTELNQTIGDGWADGSLTIHQEHLYAETVQTLLREAITPLTKSTHSPRIMLATPPGESHIIGILMAQALFSLKGAYCISMGSQIPMSELAAACEAHKADILGLSFSIAYPSRRIAPLLSEIRRILNPSIEIWAGGMGVSRVRSIPSGIHKMVTLTEAADALEKFRNRTRISPDRFEAISRTPG
ncbi:MAG: MerR family transcriptional regulator [Dechloromonas sp.]|uniref:MerR family transcriptional regulator n=1 Tax=Dechloromonas sp. TaxID=1917218 RepID=UPI0027FD17D4|nr:MerR family transcriptional regulator [Dechloromonas sp.]MBT9520073.1 MerR family transcriptional regulator [Dechloromonas sp.]